MVQAGVISVLVTASTGQANRALRQTQATFRATAMVAQSSAASTQASWAKTGKAIAAVGVVGAAVSGKLAMDFEKGMRNVNSIAQLNERQFYSLSESVRSLAGPTAQAPQTLAEGMYFLVSSGFDAKESLKVVEESAYAATAGLTTTDISAKAVAAVLNAYRMPAKKAADVSDILFRTVDRGVITFEELAMHIGDTLPFASQLGVSLVELGGATATLTKQGLKAPETMTRIRNVLQTLIKPGEDLEKVFETLGMSGEEMIAKFGFQGTLDRLISTIGLTKGELDDLSGKSLKQLKVDTSAAKDEVAKLFPNIRALGGVLGLTGTNSMEAAKNLKLVENATKGAGATSKALSQQTKSVAYQWQRAKAELAATAIVLGNELLPVASKGITVISGLGKAIIFTIGGINDLPPPLLAAVTAMGSLWAISKVVTSGFALGLFGGVMKVVSGLKTMGVVLYNSVAAFGVLRGAMLALSLAWKATPFGVIATGVGLAAAAVAAFGDELGLFGYEMSKTEKMERKFGYTTAHAMIAVKKSDKQLRELSKAVKHHNELKREEQRASKKVKEAQENLNRVRRESPDDTAAVTKAERELVQAKLRNERVDKRLSEARKAEGIERKLAKADAKQALGRQKELIGVQKEQVRSLRKQAEAWDEQEDGLKRGAQLYEALRKAERKLLGARQKSRDIIKEVGQVVGPKFAKNIEDQTVETLKYGREVGKAAAKTEREFTPTNIKAARIVGEFGVEMGKLGDNFRETGRVTSRVVRIIESETGETLTKLGVKRAGLAVDRKKAGGFTVGGHGAGDKVPVNLLLEPGEQGFIMKKSRVEELRALDEFNRRGVRGMKKGGAVPAGGFPDAMGALPGLDALAWVLKKKFGLSVVSGSRPGAITTSGNVSDHSWGGAIDVSNGITTPQMDAAHRWMLQTIGPAIKQMLYRTMVGGNHFDHIHVALEESFARSASAIMNLIGGDFGMVGKIKKIDIKGPDTAFKDIAVGVERKLRNAANAYIEKMVPNTISGMGDDLKMGKLGGPGKKVGASVYGFGEAGTGTVGASGRSLIGVPAYAELNMGTALGGLPFGKKLMVTAPTGKRAVGVKEDIGLGGGSVAGHPRQIDLWRDLAEKLGLGGDFLGLVKLQGLAEGGGTGKAAMDKLRRLRRKMSKIDEIIDVTSRTAAFAKGPAGEEMSEGERDRLIALNFKLMKNLKSQQSVARRAIKKVSEAIPEKIKGKTTRELEQEVAKLERDLTKTPDKAKEKRKNIRRRIDALNEDLRTLRQKSGDREQLSNRRRSLREILTEMQGVTGRGGRIFDTKEAIRELRSTATGGLAATGLTVDQLLSLREAFDLGIFPTAHGGGQFRAAVGQNEGLVNIADGEIIQQPGEAGGDIIIYTDVYLDGRVVDRQVRHVIREVKREDRRSASTGRLPK